MEWFFDSKGKSVASSAQKVVSDMHRHIEKQNEKIRELEQAIFKCQHICTDSLEKDIIRLEQRKRDLIAELEATDEAILDRQERLQAAREEVNRTLSHSMAGSSRKISPHAMDESIVALEEQYIEETEMLETFRELERVLFMIHRNNADEIILYLPPSDDESVDMVSIKKLLNREMKQTVDLSPLELMTTYGAKVVPNHERDFPKVRELAIPSFLLEDPTNRSAYSKANGLAVDLIHQPRKLMGQLIGAFELSLIPGVVIDLWREIGSKSSKPMYWTTTSIDSVGFAVLERFFMISTGDQNRQISQVDIFGRHPVRGHILLESVTSQEP